MTQPVHLVAVIGGDAALLPAFFAHYRALGIESFLLAGHAASENDEDFEALRRTVQQAGLDFAVTFAGPYDPTRSAAILREIMSAQPEHWFVIADSDEFQVYDRPLDQVVAWCEHERVDLVEGCFLDRVALGGALLSVASGALWTQFPLAGAFSFALLGATPTKVVLSRGRVALELGNHTAKNGRAARHRDMYAQVHHFKWTESVVERIRIRKQKREEGEWPVPYLSMLCEAIRFLDHVTANQGRIDVTEAAFMFHPCGNDYADHPRWPEIVRWVHQHWPAGW
jgi:hypothetical protein